MVDQNSQFYAILTNVGAAKQANADALGIPWKITQMGVGDANGADPTPNATQTSLINEWRRAPLNQLKVDEKNSAIIVAEQVIPADVGGKWIREIALYDADGDMVAVANCAPTYKPLLSQGSGRTQVVRMNLVVSSASNVQLKIDPSVVLATREWVTEELARQDFKHSVQVATTAPISLNGLQSIDGVALLAGARVLVKNQALAKDNGLYQVATGAWIRCSDADTDFKVTPGLLVLVEKGQVNADSAWQLVSDGPITLGVSAQDYEMAFGRTGVASGIYRSVSVDKYGRVVAATNPTTAAGYGLTDVYTKVQVDVALALKAPLTSPVLTGTPMAPTAASGSNSQQIANTAFVQAAVAALVASSPATLDTLQELAAALGNDPNFATTMVNALATKAPLASPTFSGVPKAPSPALASDDTSVATTSFSQRLQGAAGWGTYGVSGSNLPAGTDLNTMVTPGSYGQTSNAWATLALNYPAALAGTLLVQTATSSIVTQLYCIYNTGQVFSRACYTGVWSRWSELAVVDSPALRGTPTAPTAVKGNSSKQVATTEFVQARGQQFSSADTFNAPGLANGIPAHLGGIVHFWGSSAQSYSIPSVASSGAGPGACVRIHNWGTQPLSIVPQGTDKLQETLSSGYSSAARVIPPDTYVDVLHINSGLWSMFGPGVEPSTLQWSRTLATNGYSRMPNGLILQWGRGWINASTGRAAVVFPTKFPSAVHSITGSHWGGGGAMFIVDESAAVTASGFTAVVSERPSGISLGATYGFSWQAIGS